MAVTLAVVLVCLDPYVRLCDQLLRDVQLGQLMDICESSDDTAHGAPSPSRSKADVLRSPRAAVGGAVLDLHRNWAETLSGGEQQRLGFARLLYHMPAFALLDESTSAMDVALEAHCMTLCATKGITCVSVGHRPTLKQFHEVCLTLDGAGGYSVSHLGVA